jgi:ribosomal protein S18 acetylase RimI-like enzyme
MIAIRRISPADAEVLRAVRLRALSDTPLAFGSTYARESAFAPLEWQTRAKRLASADDAATFLAFDGDQCCGIIGGFASDEKPGTVAIVSMWVAPEVRRRGLGRRLLKTAEDWARERRFTHLLLDVVETNAPAIALYQSYGFEFTGDTDQYPNDKRLRELFMIKPI